MTNKVKSVAELLKEYKVKQSVITKIYDIMDTFREVQKNEDVPLCKYEVAIKRTCDKGNNIDYHFARILARSLYAEDRYTDVIEKLYKDEDSFIESLKNVRL